MRSLLRGVSAPLSIFFLGAFIGVDDASSDKEGSFSCGDASGVALSSEVVKN